MDARRDRRGGGGGVEERGPPLLPAAPRESRAERVGGGAPLRPVERRSHGELVAMARHQAHLPPRAVVVQVEERARRGGGEPPRRRGRRHRPRPIDSDQLILHRSVIGRPLHEEAAQRAVARRRHHLHHLRRAPRPLEPLRLPRHLDAHPPLERRRRRARRLRRRRGGGGGGGGGGGSGGGGRRRRGGGRRPGGRLLGGESAELGLGGELLAAEHARPLAGGALPAGAEGGGAHRVSDVVLLRQHRQLATLAREELHLPPAVLVPELAAIAAHQLLLPPRRRRRRRRPQPRLRRALLARVLAAVAHDERRVVGVLAHHLHRVPRALEPLLERRHLEPRPRRPRALRRRRRRRVAGGRVPPPAPAPPPPSPARAPAPPPSARPTLHRHKHRALAIRRGTHGRPAAPSVAAGGACRTSARPTLHAVPSASRTDTSTVRSPSSERCILDATNAAATHAPSERCTSTGVPSASAERSLSSMIRSRCRGSRSARPPVAVPSSA